MLWRVGELVRNIHWAVQGAEQAYQKTGLENRFCSQFFGYTSYRIPKEDSLKEKVRTSRDWKL